MHSICFSSLYCRRTAPPGGPVDLYSRCFSSSVATIPPLICFSSLYCRRTAPPGGSADLYSLCFSSLYCHRTAARGGPVDLYRLFFSSLFSPYCPPGGPADLYRLFFSPLYCRRTVPSGSPFLGEPSFLGSGFPKQGNLIHVFRQLPCFGKPETGEIFVRGRIRRNSTA